MESTVPAARRKTCRQPEDLPGEGKRGIPEGVDELNLSRDRERRAHLGRSMTGQRRSSEVAVQRKYPTNSGKDGVFGRPRTEIPVGELPTTTRERSRGLTGGYEARQTREATVGRVDQAAARGELMAGKRRGRWGEGEKSVATASGSPETADGGGDAADAGGGNR